LINYKDNLLKYAVSLAVLPSNPKKAAQLITRARTLLGRRTAQEVEAIDDDITWIIDDFKKSLKIENGGNFKKYLEAELRLYDDKDLLQHCLNQYAYSSTNDSNTKRTMRDYFAVFGLRYVAIAIEIRVSATQPTDEKTEAKLIRHLGLQEELFNHLYLASDCIAYAEQLSHTEKMIVKNDALEFENKQLKDNQQAEIQAKVKKEISKTKSLAAKKSHTKDYEEKEKVFAWLFEHGCKNGFISRSNNKVTEDLVKLDVFTVGFNTLLKYVSEFKKEHIKQLKTA